MLTQQRLIFIACTFVLRLILVPIQPALADNIGGQGNASASSGGNGTDQTATYGTYLGGGIGGGGGDSPCDYIQVPASATGFPSVVNGGTVDSGEVIPPGTPGTWYVCFYKGDVRVPTSVVFIPAGAGGGADPTQLLIAARSHLSLPAPPVQLSPATDLWQYVQMPTWAWVPQDAWAPLRSSTSAGPVVVTVVATPVRVVFSYQIRGDGTTATATCSGPGTPYSDSLARTENPQQPVLAASPDCGWIWHQSSADTPDHKYVVSGHIVYHAVWTIQGAPGGGDLGELPSFDTVVRVTVGEIQALNTAPR